MDDRSALAYALVAGLLVVSGWLLLRYRKERQAFKLRQTGRGKNTAQIPAE